jgi:hypothetical protein
MLCASARAVIRVNNNAAPIGLADCPSFDRLNLPSRWKVNSPLNTGGQLPSRPPGGGYQPRRRLYRSRMGIVTNTGSEVAAVPIGAAERAPPPSEPTPGGHATRVTYFIEN